MATDQSYEDEPPSAVHSPATPDPGAHLIPDAHTDDTGTMVVKYRYDPDPEDDD